MRATITLQVTSPDDTTRVNSYTVGARTSPSVHLMRVRHMYVHVQRTLIHVRVCTMCVP